MIDRNVTLHRSGLLALALVASLALSGCGGASVFTDDTLVSVNEPPPVTVSPEEVPALQSDGYPNPQQPTAPPLAPELNNAERALLRKDLETVGRQQIKTATSGQPVDRSAALRKAADERKKKILKEIEEKDRSR